MANFQQCINCVMDTTDKDITFDSKGVCNYCRAYKKMERLPNAKKNQMALGHIVNEIKNAGKGKKYDCIIGVSGGVDSTFVAYKVKELGLRPLAVHLDNGWNSELAVSNIEKTLKKLNIDLFTYVMEWEEFKDLQLSFLKASVPDAEIPTDHAIIAILHQVAAREGIRHIILGINTSTEMILPRSWSYGHNDWRYIKKVHQRFGKVKLKDFPHFSLVDMIYYTNYKNQKTVYLLNYLDFIKKDAMELIEKELGWKYYGGKHYESIYTRFFQAYLLPKKFNIDKRKAHLSNLICSGQITKAEALAELKEEPYPIDKLEEDRKFVLSKLNLTDEEFNQIMNDKPKTFWDYPSYESNRCTLFIRKGINW